MVRTAKSAPYLGNVGFYALLRGYLTGLYPYDQANFELQGVFRVFGMVGLTILFSLVLGMVLVTWDKRWSRLREREAGGSSQDDEPPA